MILLPANHCIKAFQFSIPFITDDNAVISRRGINQNQCTAMWQFSHFSQNVTMHNGCQGLIL